MKAVILAAGKSTRTYPLTLTRPKPLLKIANKTIIEHNLEQLEGIVDEVVIVTGYKGEMIRNFLGKNHGDIRIKYVEQEEQLGTEHALRQVEKELEDRFIVMNGDDLFFRKDIEKCVENNFCVLVQKVENNKSFGVVETEGKKVKQILEKPEDSDIDLVNTGLYVLDKSVFDNKIGKSSRGEYEITDMINFIAGEKKVHFVVAENWFPVSYPWDLLDANVFMLGNIEKKIEGELEKNVTIKGEVIIGKGTVVKDYTYIEGPVVIGENCVIGPHAYIRPDTTIGDKCRIRAEVVDSIIMDNTTAKHDSYLGHSVIGENVNIAAGTITADYRHDGKEHVTLVKNKKVETGRRKLGTFIGDNVKTGVNTSIYPGRKIWADKDTLPGETIKKDKK